MIRARFDAALWLRRTHGFLTVAWGLLAIPSLLWWRNSVPYVVAVSVYANLASHASAWQASRAETNQNSQG